MQSVSNYIDHTNLNQIAKNLDVEKLCKEAIDNNLKKKHKIRINFK